ncbi:MAG: hypothetical protein GY847_00620 [Proteobacteria bacterium]|nr:hypothetical protein [Pseudomonadota bacterium]
MRTFLKESAGAAFSLEPIGMVVVLLLAGIVFLAVEMFILPGFGIAGIIGLLLLVSGSVAAWMLIGPVWGFLAVTVTVVICIALGVVAFRSRALRRRLVLDTQLEPGGGTASAGLIDLIGAMGQARSDLRPAGIAMIDDRRIDVVSEGGFIEKGDKVKVVAIDGPRVIVAKEN